MNVGGVPLATDVLGFRIVVAIVMIFTALAGALVLRRRRNQATSELHVAGL